MDRAGLRRQMTEVAHAAREAMRDPAQAVHLWGMANDLCDVLERNDTNGEQYGECEMIVALREDIRAGARPDDELIEEIVWFVRAVEHVLEDEESDEICDEVVVTDQLDG